MRYSLEQFKPGEAWLVFPVDCLVQDQPVDIQLLIDVASTYVFGNIVVPGELPETKEITKLMRDAYKTKKSWPKKFFCPYYTRQIQWSIKRIWIGGDAL